MNATVTYDKTKNSAYSPLSWRNLFAGFFVGLAIANILNLIGISLGLSALGSDYTNSSAIASGSIVWLIISSSVSTFVASYITSSLSDTVENGKVGIANGLVSWAMLTLATIILAGNMAGAVMSGASNLLKNSLSAMSPNTAMVGASTNINIQIDEQVYKLIRQDILKSLQQINLSRDDLNNLLSEIQQYLVQGVLFDKEQNGALRDRLKNQITQMIVTHSNMNETQVYQMLDNWERSFQNMKDKAVGKVNEKMKEVSISFSNIIFYLILSNLASLAFAVFGGILPTRRVQLGKS